MTEFFSSVSLCAVVIAAVVAVAAECAIKLTGDKFPLMRGQLPFVAAFALYALCDCLFISGGIDAETAGAGTLCGSLSVMLISVIDRVLKGKTVTESAAALVIEGLLSGVVKDEAIKQTALDIERLILNDRPSKEAADVIMQNAVDGLERECAEKIAEEIFRAVRSAK